jgi:RHS repeat-associated protein
MTKHGSTTLASFSYSYINPTTQQATDLRYSVTDASNNVTTYTYDALNRLTEAKTTNGSTLVSDYVYTYDGAGNRTSVNANGITSSYTYNAANELTSTTTGGTTTTYSYDADGNMIGSSAGLALTYNAASQTTAINGVSQAYTGANQTERVQAGNVSFVNSPLGVSSQVDSTGATYFTRDNQNNLIDERTPSGAYYYVFDGLGSVVGLTDSSGAKVKTYAYDPYGNVTATTGSVTNPWRFASGYADASAGYIKFGARYDDPTLGRWTQEDPISGCILRPTSLNRYNYVSDEPINGTDPSGLRLHLRCFGWCIGVQAGNGCADTCVTAFTPGNPWFITAWYLFLCSQCAGHALHFCLQLCNFGGIGGPCKNCA